MLYPSINEIRKRADSRYTLVILAAKRARDIVDGKPPLTEIPVDRPVSIAAHEINEDLITYNSIAKRIPSCASEEAQTTDEHNVDSENGIWNNDCKNVDALQEDD